MVKKPEMQITEEYVHLCQNLDQSRATLRYVKILGILALCIGLLVLFWRDWVIAIGTGCIAGCLWAAVVYNHIAIEIQRAEIASQHRESEDTKE